MLKTAAKDPSSLRGLAVWLVAAPLALAAVAAASAAPGWLFMRFDSWYEKRTGRSLFDES